MTRALVEAQAGQLLTELLRRLCSQKTPRELHVIYLTYSGRRREACSLSCCHSKCLPSGDRKWKPACSIYSADASLGKPRPNKLTARYSHIRKLHRSICTVKTFLAKHQIRVHHQQRQPCIYSNTTKLTRQDIIISQTSNLPLFLTHHQRLVADFGQNR